MGILGAAVLVNFLLRRSHREQDDLLRYSLTGNTWSNQRTAGAVSPDVRNYLAERALIVSSLIARAASEIWLHHNQIPEGSQPIGRQVQNSSLRDRGLWSTLEPLERDLLSAPDGQWTETQQNEATTWCEQLRLLRWALGIDAELLPLSQFSAVDFSLANEFAAQQTSAGNVSTVRSWDARVERDLASAYVVRAVAELDARALIQPDDAIRSWSVKLRDEYSGPSIDFVVGTRTIRELNDNLLRVFTMAAHARERYSAYLADQLADEDPRSFSDWASCPPQ
jgi:hypothetical protein